jgi:hypothetical protein
MQKVFANKIKWVQTCTDARDITFYKWTAIFRTHCVIHSLLTLQLTVHTHTHTHTHKFTTGSATVMNYCLLKAFAVGVNWRVVFLLCCQYLRRYMYSVKQQSSWWFGKEFDKFSLHVIEVLTRNLSTECQKNQATPTVTTANCLVEMPGTLQLNNPLGCWHSACIRCGGLQ